MKNIIDLNRSKNHIMYSDLFKIRAHSDVTVLYAGVIFVCVHVHMIFHIRICLVHVYLNTSAPFSPYFLFSYS